MADYIFNPADWTFTVSSDRIYVSGVTTWAIDEGTYDMEKTKENADAALAYELTCGWPETPCNVCGKAAENLAAVADLDKRITAVQAGLDKLRAARETKMRMPQPGDVWRWTDKADPSARGGEFTIKKRLDEDWYGWQTGQGWRLMRISVENGMVEYVRGPDGVDASIVRSDAERTADIQAKLDATGAPHHSAECMCEICSRKRIREFWQEQDRLNAECAAAAKYDTTEARELIAAAKVAQAAPAVCKSCGNGEACVGGTCRDCMDIGRLRRTFRDMADMHAAERESMLSGSVSGQFTGER